MRASKLSMKNEQHLMFFKTSFIETFENSFRSVPLKDNKKIANGSFKRNKGFPLSDIVESKNYGLIPTRDIFVLDIDVHDDPRLTTLKDRIDFFCKVLDVDLYKSYAVGTPSGGVHIYLKLPMDYSELESFYFDLPQGRIDRVHNESDHLLEAPMCSLDSDIRSPGSLGYVVGPGSSLSGRIDSDYTLLAGKFGFCDYDIESIPLQRTTVEGLRNLKKVQKGKNYKEVSPKKSTASVDDEAVEAEKKDSKKSSRTSEKTSGNLDEISESSLSSLKDISKDKSSVKLDSVASLPDEKFLQFKKIFFEKLQKLSENSDRVSFHKKRAVLYGLMSCCYDEIMIAKTAKDLSINMDTHRKAKISDSELIKDFVRMTEKFGRRERHSKLCNVVHQFKQVRYEDDEEKTPEQIESIVKAMSMKQIARMRSTVKHSGNTDARVLDVSKIFDKLFESSRHGKVTNKIYHAMILLNGYFQPLSNVGSSVVLVHRRTLAQNFNMTESQVSEAMRLLREKKIVSVHSKQRVGMAPLYRVSSDYTHSELTFYLRNTWGSTALKSRSGRVSHSPVFFSYLSGGFVDLISGEILYAGQKVSRLFKNFDKLHEICEIVESNVELLGSYSQKMVKRRVEHCEEIENDKREEKLADKIRHEISVRRGLKPGRSKKTFDEVDVRFDGRGRFFVPSDVESVFNGRPLIVVDEGMKILELCSTGVDPPFLEF